MLLRDVIDTVEERTGGRVIFVGLFGSRSYNVALETSDEDLTVVFLAPTRAVLASPLTPVPALARSVFGDDDVNVMEAGRFAELIAGGDPRSVEALFARAPLFVDDAAWAPLLANRGAFLTRAVADKYFSDATGTAGLSKLFKSTMDRRVDDVQAELAAGRNDVLARTLKRWSIAFRLLEHTRRVLRVLDGQDAAEQFSPWLEDEDPLRQFVLDARLGRVDVREMRERAEREADTLAKRLGAEGFAEGKIVGAADDVRAERNEAGLAVAEEWLLTLRMSALSLVDASPSAAGVQGSFALAKATAALDDDARGLLSRCGDMLPPGAQVLFLTRAGSYTYDTHTAESDADYMVVYALPAVDLVATVRPARVSESKCAAGSDDDWVTYEIGKFLDMLLKAGTQAVEQLFSDRVIYTHPLWDGLRAMRRNFLTQKMVHSALGHLNSQLRSIENTVAGESQSIVLPHKRFYHIFRLLGECERLIRGDDLAVVMRGDEREFIMRIRRAELTADDDVQRLMADARRRADAIEAQRGSWQVPAEANAGPVDAWLRSVRIRFAV